MSEERCTYLIAIHSLPFDPENPASLSAFKVPMLVTGIQLMLLRWLILAAVAGREMLQFVYIIASRLQGYNLHVQETQARTAWIANAPSARPSIDRYCTPLRTSHTWQQLPHWPTDLNPFRLQFNLTLLRPGQSMAIGGHPLLVFLWNCRCFENDWTKYFRNYQLR